MRTEFYKKPQIESDPREQKLHDILVRDIDSKLNSILLDDPSSMPGPDTYQESLLLICNKLKKHCPEKITEIDDMISQISQVNLSDGETFGSHAAEILGEFILKHFNYEQIEEVSREGRNMLNRLVEYEVDEDENEIRLHIPVTFVENGIELKTLFVEALKELTKKIKVEPELANISKVTAASWMIYRISDKYLELLGFSNIERFERDSTGRAEISKAVLLEKYGQN